MDKGKTIWVPKIPIWLGRLHGGVNFYLTQFVSGHVCFEDGRVEHSVFYCWVYIRRKTFAEVELIHRGILVMQMLEKILKRQMEEAGGSCDRVR